MKETLTTFIKAQYPFIAIETFEEEWAERVIAEIAEASEPQRRVFSWKLTLGMLEYSQPREVEHNTVSPQGAIEWAIRQREPGIFVFKDLHPFLTGMGNAEVVRWLRDAISSFRGTEKTIVSMSPIRHVPKELEREAVVIKSPLPDMAELNYVLSRQLGARRISSETREKLIKAALGLTRHEAERVYRRVHMIAGKLSDAEVEMILAEKEHRVWTES